MVIQNVPKIWGFSWPKPKWLAFQWGVILTNHISKSWDLGWPSNLRGSIWWITWTHRLTPEKLRPIVGLSIGWNKKGWHGDVNPVTTYKNHGQIPMVKTPRCVHPPGWKNPPNTRTQGAYRRANGRMRVLLTRITRTPPFVQGEAGETSVCQGFRWSWEVGGNTSWIPGIYLVFLLSW